MGKNVILKVKVPIFGNNHNILIFFSVNWLKIPEM
jgi:hypothetical protein